MRTVESILKQVEEAQNQGRWRFAAPEIAELPLSFELPEDLTDKKFVEGLSCFGLARLILMSKGGEKRGRIYQIERTNDQWTDTHAYVVLNGANHSDYALNDTMEWKLTNGYVRENGEDVTRQTFKTSWENL